MKLAMIKIESILSDVSDCKTEYMRVKEAFTKTVTKTGVTEKKLNGF